MCLATYINFIFFIYTKSIALCGICSVKICCGYELSELQVFFTPASVPDIKPLLRKSVLKTNRGMRMITNSSGLSQIDELYL